MLPPPKPMDRRESQYRTNTYSVSILIMSPLS
jgi:hypothetical protein